MLPFLILRNLAPSLRHQWSHDLCHIVTNCYIKFTFFFVMPYLHNFLSPQPVILSVSFLRFSLSNPIHRCSLILLQNIWGLQWHTINKDVFKKKTLIPNQSFSLPILVLNEQQAVQVLFQRALDFLLTPH